MEEVQKNGGSRRNPGCEGGWCCRLMKRLLSGAHLLWPLMAVMGLKAKVGTGHYSHDEGQSRHRDTLNLGPSAWPVLKTQLGTT